MSQILCACGHLPAEHQNGAGRCTGRCYDDDYETEYRCVCPYFTEEKL